MPKIKIVYWRDIPAQVIAEDGRRRNRKQAKLELPKKFIIAIDSAAMKSGASETDEYLKGWRHSDPEIIGENLEKEVEFLCKDLEQSYDKERLRKLVSNAGYEKKHII